MAASKAAVESRSNRGRTGHGPDITGASRRRRRVVARLWTALRPQAPPEGGSSTGGGADPARRQGPRVVSRARTARKGARRRARGGVPDAAGAGQRAERDPSPGPSRPRSARATTTRVWPRFIARYYRHVPAEDLAERDPLDLAGAALSHRQLAASRPQGTANVRVFTPTVDEFGWTSGHTVVEIVTDDMPFLVDSVTTELSRQDRGIHLLVHPQVVVRRDVTGRLLEVLDESAGTWSRSEHPGTAWSSRGSTSRSTARPTGAGWASPAGRAVRARRRPGGGRGLAQDEAAGAGHRRRARGRARRTGSPPTRSRRAGSCWPGWRRTTSRSWGTATTAWSSATGATACVAETGSGLGHPAVRPARVVEQLRPADPAGPGEGPGEAPARAHHREHAGHRASGGLPRLRERQAVRRRRRGRRGAALPRAVRLERVHRQRPPHPRGPPQGAGGAGALRLRARQPLRQGPAADPRDVPA